MERNNDVFKVLVLPNELPFVGARNAVTATIADAAHLTSLPNGAWGLFNYSTNSTLGAATATDQVDGGANVGATTGDAMYDILVSTDIPAAFYLAYRGDGTLGTAGEVYKSSGTHIQKGRLAEYEEDQATVAVNQILLIDDWDTQSGSSAENYDWGLKIEFRGNTELYQRFGTNQASKVFMANTKCVGSTGHSALTNPEAVAQIAYGIANDIDQFLGFEIDDDDTTDAIVYTPSGTMGEAGTWTKAGSASTEDICLSFIRSDMSDTTIWMKVSVYTFSTIYSFLNVNPKYFKQRQLKGIASLIGFTCKWASLSETQAMVYSSGLGYDINELEYLAGGFTGKPGPYRQSRLHGLPFADFEYLATRLSYYNIATLEYDQFSHSGWKEYLNAEATYVAVAWEDQATPTADISDHVFPSLAAIATAGGLSFTPLS